jgi:hypothetical protein
MFLFRKKFLLTDEKIVSMSSDLASARGTKE